MQHYPSKRAVHAELARNLYKYPAAVRSVISYVLSEIVIEDTYGLWQLPRPPRFIIDIGANFGCFSAAATHLFGSVSTVAVEPVPSTFSKLTTLLRSYQNVVPLAVAYGSGKPVTIKEGKNPFMNGPEGEGSVRHSVYGMPLVEMLNYLPAHRYGIAEVNIEDTFIKMDCEGGEAALTNPENEADLLLLKDALGFSIEFHGIDLISIWKEHLVEAVSKTHHVSWDREPTEERPTATLRAIRK